MEHGTKRKLKLFFASDQSRVKTNNAEEFTRANIGTDLDLHKTVPHLISDFKLSVDVIQ